MKKTVTLLLALFTVLSGFAQKTNIHLIVLSSSGEKFYLILDGIKQNSSAEASVKVSGIKSGMHEATIAFENNIPDVKDKIYTIWEGQETDNREFTYVLEKKGDKYRLRFLNSVELPAKNNKTQTDSAALATDVPKPCTSPMELKEFDEAARSIGMKSTEDSRLQSAKELAEKNCVSTAQIKEICEMFEYDASRLEFLKSAYDHCTDKQNYKTLVNVFGYKNSKREFEEWVNTK